MARSILNGVTLEVVISTLSMPCSSITSASLTLAVQIPTEPLAIWRRAICGHL
jgi:hypothetical protein